jgi:hypothetical protein
MTLILQLKERADAALCLSILLYGSEVWYVRKDLFNRLRHVHHRCARTIRRTTIVYTIRHRLSTASLFERLTIELFETYYNIRLLRWTGHVARMRLMRAPIKNLTCWVDNPLPCECPQIDRGRTLKKDLLSNDLPAKFVGWREIAAGQNQWRAVCGSKSLSATKETLTSSRPGTWAELRYGTVPS